MKCPKCGSTNVRGTTYGDPKIDTEPTGYSIECPDCGYFDED